MKEPQNLKQAKSASVAFARERIGEERVGRAA
jgi:hypothetical protein